MKKPFLHALAAALYIVFIVLFINSLTPVLPQKTIIIPMTILSLFVLSAAIMGFIFLSEPLKLYLDGHKSEATAFFGKTLGVFACFVVIFIILLLLTKS